MIPQEIKQISIREYLKSIGIHPVKDYGYYGMYYCPHRNDRNVSFKVDYNKNVWCDFGTNEGGSIIDLVMRLENCSFQEAANRLEGKCAYMQKGNQQDNQPHNLTTTIQNIIPITHPKLIVWVQERKINLNLANRYCKEIHYRIMDFLKLHKEVYTYLDNDEAGRKATELIKSNCVSVNNRAERYTGFKDLNDYLCQKQIVKPEVKKKKTGLKI